MFTLRLQSFPLSFFFNFICHFNFSPVQPLFFTSKWDIRRVFSGQYSSLLANITCFQNRFFVQLKKRGQYFYGCGKHFNVQLVVAQESFSLWRSWMHRRAICRDILPVKKQVLRFCQWPIPPAAKHHSATGSSPIARRNRKSESFTSAREQEVFPDHSN